MYPPDKYFTEAAEYLIEHDPAWCEVFCDGCPRLCVCPASFCDPGGADCDAGLNPLNECCFRREELFDDPDVYREARGLYAEDMDEEDGDTHEYH
jgi:hypothetical protein